MFIIRTARPEEHAAAFRLIFGHLDEEERTTRVANALTLVSTGELDAAAVLVVETAGRVVGATAFLQLKGASGLVWPAQVLAGPERVQQEDKLVQEACNRLRSGGAKLGQAILAPPETDLAVPLLRNGFQHVTRLIYLRHELETAALPPAGLMFETYGSGNRRLFHETLLRTYEESRDCPELNGVRTIDEIIEGHQAQGEFAADRWLLAFSDGRPAGVALAVSTGTEWDLAYVGVVPEARGRGIGRGLVQLVVRKAGAAGATGITVAVDSRNTPAWNLYAGLGFEQAGRREVYLSFFHSMC